MPTRLCLPSLVCNFPPSAAAAAGSSTLLHFPRCPQPFLPSPAPPCWWRRTHRRTWEDRAQHHRSLSAHVPFQAHLTEPTVCAHRHSEALRKEGRMGPIWPHLPRTIKTVIFFDLIIPLLGTASKEMIQKNSKKDTCTVYGSVIYNKEKVKANAVSQSRKRTK